MKKNRTLIFVSQTILIFVTLVVLYPLLFLLFTSLKSNAEFLTNLFGLPKVYQWGNYIDAWSKGGISLYLLNSVLVSVAAVVLTLIIAILGGYSLAKMHIPKSEIIIMTFLAVSFLPGMAIYITLYKMMAGIRLTQSLFAMILPYAAWNLPIGMYILKKSFESVPTEILESARIDGCGELRILIQVVLPLVTPAVATVVVLTYIFCWGELMWAQIVTSASMDTKTLPIGLLNFQDEMGVNWGLYTAGLCIVTMPLIVVFAYFQKYFISGLTQGAVKG
ncbi:MAG: carbohydrate ABC transporter permease [Chitinispirillia bacterium]|jgi:raffinose/stachyose/melibiose transport system permease protein